MSSASGADNLKTAFIGDATAINLQVKNLTVGSRGTQNGTWVTYTPTVVSSSGTPLVLGGTVIRAAKYQVIGSTMNLQFFIDTSAAGTAGGAGVYQFALPAGYSIKPLSSGQPDAGIVGSGYLRANAIISPCYVTAGMTSGGSLSATNLRLVALVNEVGPAAGVGLEVSDSVYDAASTNGVTYNFQASFEIAGV